MVLVARVATGATGALVAWAARAVWVARAAQVAPGVQAVKHWSRRAPEPSKSSTKEHCAAVPVAWLVRLEPMDSVAWLVRLL